MIKALSVVGCSVTGVDVESESFLKTAENLKTSGKLPEDFTVPEDFGIKLKGFYTIETLGEGKNARKIAYLRLVRTGEDTVPMFCVLLDGNGEEGGALLKIEFCSIRISFKLS